MRYYRVVIKRPEGRLNATVVIADSIWHAIDKVYSKRYQEQPDRKQYSAYALKG